MTEYPYPAYDDTDTRIYRPPQLGRQGWTADDSMAPLNLSESMSQYPVDTSSPQVITTGSSFEDSQAVGKARRPKKGKKSRQGVAASVDEKEAMVSVGYSSAADSSELLYTVLCFTIHMCTSH